MRNREKYAQDLKRVLSEARRCEVNEDCAIRAFIELGREVSCGLPRAVNKISCDLDCKVCKDEIRGWLFAECTTD